MDINYQRKLCQTKVLFLHAKRGGGQVQTCFLRFDLLRGNRFSDWFPSSLISK